MGGKPVNGRLEVEREDVILSYKAGESLDSLSSRFGCSPTPLRAFLKRHNVIIRPSVRPKCLSVHGSTVESLYRSGVSTVELAKRFGVDRNTVGAFLRYKGILRDAPLAKRGFHIESDSDKGMLAGLLLGEGSIIIRGNGASIRIVNQDTAIIGWLAKFGGKIYWSKPRPGSVNPCGVWDLSRSVDVFHCLVSLRSLLVGKKRQLMTAAIHVLKKNYGFRETP